MKRKISIILALALLLTFVAIACDTPDPAPVSTPDPTPAPPAAETPPPDDSGPIDIQVAFEWNNYADRQPGSDNKPEFAPNGANIWWDNWANLRASNENGALQINFRPELYDPDDYDDLYDYFARPGDWMGNFGEAVNMWGLDGIQYCKYMIITMAGQTGGEEDSLILQFQPSDGPLFAARFADLITESGENVVISKDMQDIKIDLQASGFPGMTNRMHIRAFAECTIFIEQIMFTEPTGPIDTESDSSIIDGFSVAPTIENLNQLPIRSWSEFVWNSYTERQPGGDNKPEFSVNGMNIWWDNWANLSAAATDIGIQIEFTPAPFDSRDFDDEDDYFARASDWMGNFGEAVNMWALDGIAFCRFLVINMMGLEGGEENKLMLHFQPEDGPSYVARFSDLVSAGGGNVVIPNDMQGGPVVIDLLASGFPGMTNRMHIRAFAECGVIINSIAFLSPIAALDSDDPVSGMPPAIGNPADLPIRDFIAELS